MTDGSVPMDPRFAAVEAAARAEGGGTYAVRRYNGAKPPFRYALGPENVMMAGAAPPKRVVVLVRVDQDGDALSRQPGDLSGGPTKAVAPNGSVDVTVDRAASR